MEMILNCSSIPLKISLNRNTALKPPFLILAAAAPSYSNSTTTNNNSINRNSNQRIDPGKLRTQLDQLHAEAETTRSKANNARLRLMRLSEAAESLQKRAANSISVGKETEARELLVQKKKLMQVLEKSKNRIDVLDKLAVKINEAISMKEAQLIGNVAMYPEFTQEESSHQIRFVNPKVENGEDSNKTSGLNEGYARRGRDDYEQDPGNCEENLPVYCEKQGIEVTSSIGTTNVESLAGDLDEISSYEEFLQRVDRQLQHVESELVTVLKLSSLILENEEMNTSTKVKQTSEILKDICVARERIASIIKGANGR